MEQLTLQIPTDLYERLCEKARRRRISPEGLTREVLWQVVGSGISATKARQQAQQLLQAHVGRLVHFGRPTLDAERWVWRVPVVTNVRRPHRAERVGEVVVDARTGEVVTDSAEMSALLQAVAPALGLRGLAGEQAARWEALRQARQERVLTPVEQAELERLADEAEALLLADLEDLANRLAQPAKRSENLPDGQG